MIVEKFTDPVDPPRPFTNCNRFAGT